MLVVGQFLVRFWVAALALSILLWVLSLVDLVKVARKTWGWWDRNPHTPELLRPPKQPPPRRTYENPIKVKVRRFPFHALLG